MTSEKSKGKRRSRKTPVAGTPEAAAPIAGEQEARPGADSAEAKAGSDSAETKVAAESVEAEAAAVSAETKLAAESAETTLDAEPAAVSAETKTGAELAEARVGAVSAETRSAESAAASAETKTAAEPAEAKVGAVSAETKAAAELAEAKVAAVSAETKVAAERAAVSAAAERAAVSAAAERAADSAETKAAAEPAGAKVGAVPAETKAAAEPAGAKVAADSAETKAAAEPAQAKVGAVSAETKAAERVAVSAETDAAAEPVGPVPAETKAAAEPAAVPAKTKAAEPAAVSAETKAAARSGTQAGALVEPAPVPSPPAGSGTEAAATAATTEADTKPAAGAEGGTAVKAATATGRAPTAGPASATASATAAAPATATAGPVAIDNDGWPLDPSDAVVPEPQPAQAAQASALPQMPSPAAAAYEAARIVGEMVGDIESAPGAALVAAAAAGAAIEVARARVAAGEPDRSLAAAMAADAGSTDPVVTVRMQRDRILRALAEDIAANATSTASAESAGAPAGAATGERAASQLGTPARVDPSRAPSQVARAPSQVARAPSQISRLPSQPGDAEDVADDEFDPVAIAAAAIARLRDRARTDLAELRVHYHRHDILVLVIAFLIIVAAGRVHEVLATPPTESFDPSREHGLTFEYSRGWLTSRGGPLPSPRIAHEVAPPSGKPSDTLYRVELTSTVDPTARIEVLIDKKPAWSNIVTGLDLDRRTRWGELYTLDDSSVRSVGDHQWLRTAYRFAHVLDKGDVPRIDRAVEYATVDREQIYVLTFFGTPAEIERIEEVVAPTLRVATQTGLPLVPQTGRLSSRKYPDAVSRAFESAVMVVVADVVDGRLRARGGGSGVIVGREGSILTNYHVIHDKNGRLHDVFVIGRFSEKDKAPQLYCAGKPSRSKLQRELDLALIKCDLDLDGRRWSPTASGATWPTLPQARTADIKMGQRIWILGYPDVGGGGLTLSKGEVEGWSGVDGTVGKDFIKTEAGAIRHGNSGGPVVDDYGLLVGIAAAVRTRQNAAGDIVEAVQAGGRIRPIAVASDLLAIAAAGWTPREGHTDVELQPSAIEVPSEGVQLQSRVLDVANEAPIRDALVMVLRPGLNARTVDVNRLDDQVLAYGRSNAQGEVLLKQPVPVPGTYTLMVVARGYEPVIAEGEVMLEANTPPIFDPWGKILLRAR